MTDVPRIGIVGARRNRQGLGPYMARFFHELDASVTGVLGTSQASADTAAEELRSVGITAHAYSDPTAFFSASDIDAVAIASPHESHLSCLEHALDYGKHVLCEKPFVWAGADASAFDPGAESARLARAFVDRDLVLRENVQWPYTLAAYRDLYPSDAFSATSLEFLLGPAAHDSGRITDSLSHVLSLLQVLSPLDDVPLGGIEFEAVSATELLLRFDYPGQTGTIATRVELRHSPQPPRPAGYGIDGRFAHREIEPESYRMSFHDRADSSGRSVPLSDPMSQLIADFIADVTSGATAFTDGAHSTGPQHIAPRMRALLELYDAYRERFRD